MAKADNLQYVKVLKEEYLEYERLNKFFMLSADLICIAGFDGFFKKINPAVSVLLGYSEEELFSRPINDFVFQDDKAVTATSRSNIHKGTPLVNFENRYQTKSGEIVWLSWTSIPEPENQIVFAIAKNVTKKKRAEEERHIFTENLAKINADLKQFTRMTSHDMRSPISNLLSIFNLLDISKIPDQETAELIMLLKRTSEKLHDTVNNFVEEIKKKDHSEAPVQLLHLGDILNTVVNSISSLLTDSGAIISSDFTECDTVMFNRLYLESVFLNLLTNAIKYAQPDKLPIIRIRTQTVNNCCQLIFTDNGLGFDMPLVKDKIFGLYQVFHDRPDSKGIGLHLVYTHIRALGGDITVESKVNEGTSFTITFKH